jgi:hypothetical protein
VRERARRLLRCAHASLLLSVFMVKGDARVESSCVALNAIQRRARGLPPGRVKAR